MKRTVLLASLLAWGSSLPCALSPREAQALPGFFAGKDSAERVSRSTQVVIMNRDDQNVVTVMTDYDGPNQPFALVLPVPKDVTLEGVATLKRGAVERLDELTAPRFHEFWEKDPCEPGKPEQIWERSLVASESTDFLGVGGDMFENTTKAPPEMKLKVDPDLRQEGSEFTFHLVPGDVASWLKGKGYQLPAGLALDAYSNMAFLVAVVNPSLVELGKRGESLLSGIRYATKQPVKVASTLGLAHAKGHQELIIYTLHPDSRYDVANYKSIVPPTNLVVDFKVKERMGEYYAALHDLLLAKDPQAFLAEYAWDTESCGQPCPNARLALHELLTLGADVFESNLSKEVAHPVPPERTKEEEDAYKKKKKDEKKEDDELRAEVARRKALIERQGKFILSRLHHRYDAKGLPKDIELKRAAPIQGGVDIPKGEHGELPQGSSSADQNRLQTRFVGLHPNISVIKCEAPERYRWEKPPLTYRGARKIWIADQLASRDRAQLKPVEMTLTAVPELGLPGGRVDQAADAVAGEQTAAEEKSKSCDCSVPGATNSSASVFGASALGLCALAWRRRRRDSNAS